ncbi:uroporphyrinogen-III synthase [Dyella ginsengisoli]|uniref:Uroporphyrinogen-III synthase n=1 Tax=Dyella ginsengisoli TaxID=363848 RepID=A0ABW8JZV9_9GAMM
MPQPPAPHDLHGRVVVITRPVGAAAAVMRRVRAAGGCPLHVPGMALRAIDDAETRVALAAALRAERVVFTSPASVRFAHALQPLLPADCPAIGVGQGTARALERAGVRAPVAPSRQDSEGVLALPALQALRGTPVALIGAEGGRGLLREALAARGAELREVHVYRRVPPRLDRRHVDPLLHALPADACVLLSSAEAIAHLRRQLPDEAWRALCGITAVVSSARLREVARAAGWTRLVLARSALPADLVEAASGAGVTQS